MYSVQGDIIFQGHQRHVPTWVTIGDIKLGKLTSQKHVPDDTIQVKYTENKNMSFIAQLFIAIKTYSDKGSIKEKFI